MIIDKYKRKEFKKKYSKSVYKALMKMHAISPLDVNESELNVFFNILSQNDDKKILNELIFLYKNNPSLLIRWVINKNSMDINEFKKYLNIFGEKLLSYETEFILSIDINHENILPFIPHFKENNLLLEKLKGNINEIYQYGKANISQDVINNHLDHYIIFLNRAIHYGNNLDTREINKLCCFGEDNFNKFYKCKDLLASCFSPNINSMDITMIMRFLIDNPSYLDGIMTNVKETKYKFDFLTYLKSLNNKEIIGEFVNVNINDSENFKEQKKFLYCLLFPKLSILLKDMIKRKNKYMIKYDDDINKYLECFIKFENAKDNNDLKEVFSYYDENVIIDIDDMKERIIVEYNKFVNLFLTKAGDIKKNNNAKVVYEDYYSQKYNKSGKIEIVELYGVPFNYLSHVIVKEKTSNNHIFAERNKFINELRNNPDLWSSSPEHGTNYISLSMGNDSAIRNFGIPAIILCFDNVKDKQIKLTKKSDANTSLSPNTSVENTLELIDPEELTRPNGGIFSNNNFTYNEIVSSRNGVLPSYLLVASKPNSAGIPTLTDEIREWALYYNIPIHRIDCDAYFQINYNKFIEYKNMLRNSGSFPSQVELISLFNLQTSAYQYTIENPKSTVALLLDVINVENKVMDNENMNNFYDIIRILDSWQLKFEIESDDKFKNQIEFLKNYAEENKVGYLKK